MTKYIVLDTETTNSLDDPIVYDIGWAVVDENGEVYETASYVVADVFCDSDLMASAFFADKIPAYWEDIHNGNRVLARYRTIRAKLAQCIENHKVTIICAHNARFDYRSVNLTQRFLTNSRYRFFFPYGIEIWDTLKMAREVFKANEEYDTFCYENEYVTKRGCKRYTAEILYRFLTGDNDFVESHTGLEDVMIEKEILVECLRRGCENGKLWG